MKSRLLILIVVAGALLLHVGLTLRNYPLSLLRDGEIPLRGDIARYFATAHGAAEVGGLYGYDPHFMAGYPVGLWNSMGKKAYELLHLALPWVALPKLFTLTLIGFVLFTPLALWWACLGITGFKREGNLFLLLWILVYWHLSTQIAYFWYFGNIFFPAAAAGLVMLLTFAYRMFLRERTLLWGTATGAMAAALFYAHTVVLIAGLFPLGVLLLTVGLKAPRRRALTAGAAAVGVFALLAAPWLLPLLATQHDCVAAPQAWFHGGLKFLIMDFFSDRVYQQHFDRNFLFQVAMVLGVAGTWLAVWLRAPAVIAVLGAGGIGALAIAYLFPGFAVLRSVQPYRFTIVAMLFFLVPACYALRWCKEQVGSMRARQRAVVAVIAAILAPQVTGYLIDLTWPRERPGLAPEHRQVIEAVAALQPSGRVLCDDATIGHMLPYVAGVPVLGGLSTQAFLKHGFAGMDENGVLFGRPAASWKPRKLEPYLQVYNVEYAVFSKPPWSRFAQAHPHLLQPVITVAGHTVYRVATNAPSWLKSGDADVRADYRGIHVTQVRRSPLVLKFHFAHWLSAGDGIVLTPVTLLDDPVPFIRVEAPIGASFTIARKGTR